jgi:hypothetical protein
MHLDEVVAAALHHLPEEGRAAAVAVHEGQDVHVANVYIRGR